MGSGGRTSGRYQNADQIGNIVRRYSVMYNPYALYEWDLFYRRLWLQYGYMSRYDYLSLYANGVSPLTEDATRLALRNCVVASEGVVQLSDRLQRLLDGYAAGSLTEGEFERGVDETLAGIRAYAKYIRRDDYLNFLDQRKDRKWDSIAPAQSVAELEALVQELRQTAVDVNSGITAFGQGEGVHVISVKNLEQASFRSMTKKLDKLTKSIDKSVRHL